MTPSDQNPRESELGNVLRDEQHQHVRDELEARLRHRGATLDGSESDDEVLGLANAVDAFESAVMRVGGDLMVDTPESSQPDNPERVLPQRRADEPAGAYAQRIREAADRIAGG